MLMPEMEPVSYLEVDVRMEDLGPVVHDGRDQRILVRNFDVQDKGASFIWCLRWALDKSVKCHIGMRRNFCMGNQADISLCTHCEVGFPSVDVRVVGLKPDVFYFISGELLELLHIIERCPSLFPTPI